MIRRTLLLCVLWLAITLPCEAQQVEQRDSLAVLQQKVQELDRQLQQLTDLVIRLESRLLIQEQRARRSLTPSLMKMFLVWVRKV